MTEEELNAEMEARYAMQRKAKAARREEIWDWIALVVLAALLVGAWYAFGFGRL